MKRIFSNSEKFIEITPLTADIILLCPSERKKKKQIYYILIKLSIYMLTDSLI